ncbi:hypothetical protein MAGCAS_217 [Candidatus Hodgkinia cicadicola]|uniref:Uncharacterized protein n=1 Tax=Candidatus Hodgkinia cicadicola TaxID=573658 RepID=A0ABX4MEN7_9HYPH|nr:hypothetical protein MAGCAS_217 [Candidatus Hodgkinia cicadicola]PIM96400.1 hypothetical protein magtcs_260 [Candidatus Hodgkinia cicadicola]
MLALFNSKFSKWSRSIMVDKMLLVLSKINKIRTGIIPVPSPMCKVHSPKDLTNNCKYFNEVCDYNDLIKLMVYSVVFRTRIKLVVCYRNNNVHSVNTNLVSFDYGVVDNPLFSITGFDNSNTTSRWLKCFTRSMPMLGKLTTWPRDNRIQGTTIPSLFIKLERDIAKRLA